MSQESRRALLALGGLIVAGLVVDYYSKQQPGSTSVKVGSISGVSGSGSVTVAGQIYGGGFPPLSPVASGCRCGS